MEIEIHFMTTVTMSWDHVRTNLYKYTGAAIIVTARHVRNFRGASRISEKGVHIYNGEGIALLIISNF